MVVWFSGGRRGRSHRDLSRSKDAFTATSLADSRAQVVKSICKRRLPSKLITLFFTLFLTSSKWTVTFQQETDLQRQIQTGRSFVKVVD